MINTLSRHEIFGGSGGGARPYDQVIFKFNKFAFLTYALHRDWLGILSFNFPPVIQHVRPSQALACYIQWYPQSHQKYNPKNCQRISSWLAYSHRSVFPVIVVDFYSHLSLNRRRVSERYWHYLRTPTITYFYSGFFPARVMVRYLCFGIFNLPITDDPIIIQRTFLREWTSNKSLQIQAIGLSLYEPLPGSRVDQIGQEVVRTQWLWVFLV